MTMRARLRLLFAALLTALLSLALVAPAEARPRAHYPDRIELPNAFLPEGITIGKRPVAYLGSRADGDIYAADLRTGRGRVISQGPGTPSIGLKITRKGLLYVAGGPSGTARLVSTRTGKILSTYTFVENPDPTTNPTFVNDVVLTRRAAWFTDSQKPQLYRVSRGSGRVTTRPLGGDWVQVAGQTNANGIARTPDGRALLVVQTVTGYLFRVDPATGAATRVDLGGAVLTNGDGLLLHGRTLYVVQNRLNQVAVVKLDRRGTEGEVVDTLTSPDFDVPTTVAAYKGSLYLPNARFTTPPEPTTPYWITRIDR